MDRGCVEGGGEHKPERDSVEGGGLEQRGRGESLTGGRASELCGGRRRVVSYVKDAGRMRATLEHLRLPTAGARLTPARGPPQQGWC